MVSEKLIENMAMDIWRTDVVDLDESRWLARKLVEKGYGKQSKAAPAVRTRWIPVAERKPEGGVKVLVSVKGRDEALIGWYDADWEDWVVEEDLSEKKLMPVTHWQEKPLPAKEG